MFGQGNRLGWRRRQNVDSDLPLDVRFVLRTSTGAFSCVKLNGAPCWSTLSTLARFEVSAQLEPCRLEWLMSHKTNSLRKGMDPPRQPWHQISEALTKPIPETS
jgi:hypothetical protein